MLSLDQKNNVRKAYYATLVESSIDTKLVAKILKECDGNPDDIAQMLVIESARLKRIALALGVELDAKTGLF